MSSKEQTRNRLSDAQKPFVPEMTEPIQRYGQPEAPGSNSDPYAIQENRQAQYTNPYDIPSGYNPNDYVYNSTQQAPTNDPHGKTWTDEQEKRKRLQDAMTQRDNLKNSFVGMPTTKVVLKLGEFDDTIQRLSQELGVGDSVANTPLGQGFVADVVDREQEIADQSTKPSVPTMTEPIPEYSQPEEQSGNSDPYAIQEPRQVPYTNPYDIPGDYNPNDYVYSSEQTPVYTNPYDIPWTGEQEKRKRLSDDTIERDNLLKSFVGMPTTENVVKLGEYDDEIKQLTQELGLGQKEYTPGVDGGWQEDIGEAPSNINIIGDVLSGKWIIDAATGALKWVQDNAENIQAANQAAQAAEKRLLETPIQELDLKQLEEWKEIQLKAMDDECKRKAEEEYVKLTEERIAIYVEAYNERTLLDEEYLKDDGITNTEQYVEWCLEVCDWEKKTKKELRKKHDRQYQIEQEEMEKRIYRIDIPDEIEQDITGDPKTIDYIWAWKQFEYLAQNVKLSLQSDQVEGKIELYTYEVDKVVVPDEDAKEMYATILAEEEIEYSVTEALVSEGASFMLEQIPGVGKVLGELLGDPIGDVSADFLLEEDYANKFDYDIADLLGGTYTVRSPLKTHRKACENIKKHGIIDT